MSLYRHLLPVLSLMLLQIWERTLLNCQSPLCGKSLSQSAFSALHMGFVYFHWFGSNDRRRTFFRFPFDVKNPCGYSIAVALQFIFSFNLDLAVACISIIVIALSLVLISTVDDMMCGLNMLNTSAKRHESHFKITQQFSQFVQFNSKGKQLSKPKFQCHWNWYISILSISVGADWPTIFQNWCNSYSWFFLRGQLEACAWLCLQLKSNWFSEFFHKFFE